MHSKCKMYAILFRLQYVKQISLLILLFDIHAAIWSQRKQGYYWDNLINKLFRIPATSLEALDPIVWYPSDKSICLPQPILTENIAFVTLIIWIV